jgi:hypothetical protein
MHARLGDDIDDFCVKCKRVMNHSVVSLMGDEPAKVRCRTCHQDHDYRHEQAPPPKVDPRKAALFNEVLKTVAAQTPAEGGQAAETAEGQADAAEGQAEAAEGQAEAKPKARKKARA